MKHFKMSFWRPECREGRRGGGAVVGSKILKSQSPRTTKEIIKYNAVGCVYSRDDRAVNVRPSSQSSGRFCFSSSSTVSLRTSLM